MTTVNAYAAASPGARLEPFTCELGPLGVEKLEALRVGLHSARETASELIAQGAGLNFGFNAGDGD